MTGSEFLANLPKGLSACPFLEHGCHKVGNEMDVKLHVRDDRMLHLVLLCRAVSEVRRVRIQHFLELPRTLLQLDNTLYPALVAERKYGDQCIFRIKNINMTILNARNEANQLLFSQPFETHRYGYKMTLIIAPFGDAGSARQYLSVYVTIVKGDYDDVLRWPFIYPITFIAHAANSRDNLTKKLVPNPTPENDVFLGRPKTRNAAFGFQRFCKLIDIDKYTVSGDFFLSVHVDLSSMETDRTPRKSSDQL
ncbi:hypothetical protein Q1695_010216 [Nippostrongylus brasiliensis]|nr:hypothetical protein Q1695_010216 [Nippostrongylus brasiliensis]